MTPQQIRAKIAKYRDALTRLEKELEKLRPDGFSEIAAWRGKLATSARKSVSKLESEILELQRLLKNNNVTKPKKLTRKGKRLSSGAYEPLIRAINDKINSELFGQTEMTRVFLACLIAQINLSLVGNSGCGKTHLTKVFRDICGLRDTEAFSLIVGHSEIMESNFVDSMQPDSKGKFVNVPGPLSQNMARLLVIDEYNRINPRSLAHLLEPLNEKWHDDHPLGLVLSAKEQYFNMVMTMNPVSQGGNYPPPEAILDRIGYQYFADVLSSHAIEQLLETNGKTKPESIDVEAEKLLANHLKKGLNNVNAGDIFEALIYLWAVLDAEAREDTAKKAIDEKIAKLLIRLRRPQDHILHKIQESMPSPVDRNKPSEDYLDGKSSYEANALRFESQLQDLGESQINKKYVDQLLLTSGFTQETIENCIKIDSEDIQQLKLTQSLRSSATARMTKDLRNFVLAYAFVSQSKDYSRILERNAANCLVHRTKFVGSTKEHEKVEIIRRIAAASM